MTECPTVRLVPSALGPALLLCVACGGSQRTSAPLSQRSKVSTPAVAPSVHQAAQRPEPSAGPKAPCDDAKPGPACLETALTERVPTEREHLLLAQACRRGNPTACLIEPHDHDYSSLPLNAERRAAWTAACGLGRKVACSRLLSECALRRSITQYRCAMEPQPDGRSLQRCEAAPGPCAFTRSSLPGYRVVRRELALRAVDGTEVALTGHPGAVLLALREHGGSTRALVTQFVRQPYRVEPGGRVRTSPSEAEPILVELPSDALAVEGTLTAAPVALPGKPPPIVVWDQKRIVLGGPTGGSFGVKLHCGAVSLLERKRDEQGEYDRLAQSRDGITARGFTRELVKWSWESRGCKARTRSPHFDDPMLLSPVATVDPVAAKRGAAELARSRRLYSVMGSETGPKCQRWDVVNGRVEYTLPNPEGRLTLSYGLAIHDTTVTITGPSEIFRSHDGKTNQGSGWGDSRQLQLVAVDGAAFSLVRGFWPVEGYVSTEAFRWFKTRAACESALRQQPQLALVWPNSPGVATGGFPAFPGP